MTKGLLIIVVLVCLFSCKREMNASSGSIVGKWLWVRSYNVGFDPSPIGVNKGIYNFESNLTWTRIKNNEIADSGRYALFQSLQYSEDSINFCRNSVPAFPIIDSSYALYSVQGDSLQMGSLINPLNPVIWLYGTVDVYVRQ
jgi:hypothetical protein